MRTSMFILVLAMTMLANCQTATQPVGQNQHQEASDPHSSGVDTRGDHAMGFSHETSTHHFRLLSDGGAIEVTANDRNDKVTRDEIKNHLSHIVQMFTNGNFQIPMFIHDKVPPGVAVMESKRATISYTFEQTPNGGRIRIATADKDALEAIHEFLVFQIEDHRTGDSNGVETPH